jgi:CRISPR/Cas system-associated exonuclease Cas4 (RecB family)
MKQDFLNKEIDAYLSTERKEREIGRYYASELGMCARKLFFLYKFPKELDSETRRIFAVGDLFHDFIYKVLKDSKKIDLLENERSITLVTESGISIAGRIDNLIYLEDTNEKIIIDVKTTKSLEYITSPKKEHKMQVMVYLKGFGLKKGAILYVQKDNLRIKYFEFEYDEDIVAELIDKAEFIHRCLTNDIIPHKVGISDRWQCNYCPYRLECIDSDKELDKKSTEVTENATEVKRDTL